MRPRDRSAQYDRRRLIERIADKRRPTLRAGAGSVAGGAGLTGVGEIAAADLDTAGWYDWNWRYRIPIIVDRSKVSGSCANYPLYLSDANMPAGFFAAAQASGNDVLVTAADGVTKLPHDLVHWYPYGTGAIEDAGRLLTGSYGADVDFLPTRGYGDYGIGPTMELHALLPMLDPEPIDDAGRLLTRAYGGDPGYIPSCGLGDLGDSAADIVAWVYAGNPVAADQRNAAGVWAATHAGVYHLGDASGDYADSTGNGYTGTDNVDPGGKAGKLFSTGGETFDGSNDWINTSGTALLPAGIAGLASAAISLWVKRTAISVGSARHMVNLTTTGAIQRMTLRIDAANTIALAVRGASTDSTRTGTTAATIADTTTWHHVVAVANIYNDTMAFYVDGAPVSYSGTMGWGSTEFSAEVGGPSAIGASYDGSGFRFPGIFDEVRLLKYGPSAAEVATVFANQSAPATFYTVGTPQIARL